MFWVCFSYRFFKSQFISSSFDVCMYVCIVVCRERIECVRSGFYSANPQCEQ